MKLWIDGAVLVELLAKGDAGRYVDTFGTSGMVSLDGKLRQLETILADALVRKLSSDELAAALGPDWAKAST